jgi:hypothetical protein
MKIAINSLPRSGTKFLQANFHRYIKSAGYNVLCPESFDSILEPFNFLDHELELKATITGIESIDQHKINFVKKYRYPKDINSETIDRYSYLKSLKQSWVFKRTPWVRFDPILYESAVELDKCVAIVRSDMFEHTLSFVLARQLNIWAPTNELETAVETCKNKPIKLNEDEFIQFYKWIKQYNKIKWVKDIQVVDFDKMVKIKNSKEFCDFFNLPFVNFDFHYFHIEYGDNKRKMISNIKELRVIAKSLDLRND